MYFGRGAELINCLRWVGETEKDDTLATGSALTFTKVKQLTADTAIAIARGKEGSWLFRKCLATSVVGTEYMVKGDDIVTRLGPQDVFSDYPLIMSSTKRQKVRFTTVLEMDNNNADKGITETHMYAGDLNDFVVPETDWKKIATIPLGWDFRRATKANLELSDLLKGNNTKEGPPCVLRFKDNTLSICSAEKGGSLNGTNMITSECGCICKTPYLIAIRGRYLVKIRDLFSNENPVINVYLDDLEDPTKVCFDGDLARVEISTVPLYTCQALSQGAMLYFYGENLKSSEHIASRQYPTESLLGFVKLQTPKNEDSPDTVLEVDRNKMVISKRNQVKKSERSFVSAWNAEGVGEWQACVVKHDLFTRSLEVIRNYIKSEIDQAAKEYSDYQEESDPQEKTAYNVVELRQCKIGVNKREVNVIYIESPVYKSCRILLFSSTLASTTDKVNE
jgi:hypothetical protein